MRYIHSLVRRINVDNLFPEYLNNEETFQLNIKFSEEDINNINKQLKRELAINRRKLNKSIELASKIKII
jgi:hypothetical protein